MTEQNKKDKLTVDPAEVECRVVSNDELRMLDPIFDRLGWPLPDPDFAKAVVAEADGLVLGFGIVQFLPHAEPMYVEPAIRGTGVAEKLADAVCSYIENDCHITRYLANVKPGSFAERLCLERGFVPVPGQLMKKQTA